MSKQLIPFNEDATQVPAHLRNTFGPSSNNELAGGVSTGYPVLSYKGKTWALNEGGTRTIIMRPGTDDEPASSLEVVIIKANPNLSKVYYEGGYVEGSDSKPVCYSNDGHAPAGDAVQPQCSTCQACPHNAWGSRITENGSKGKACADSRRVAVAPSGELGRAMLLRVPAATLKDLAAYAEMLTRRNAPYQAVVTKIGFDMTVAHPKLTFKAVRWLDQEEATEVSGLMTAPVVDQITGVAAGPVRTSAAAASVAALPPKPALAKPAPKAEAKPEPKPEPKPAARTTSFGAAKKPEPKPEPPQSKVATKLTAASDDLDNALAELDDM